MDPLDDTRIHPESYELAKKMAKDIYCEEVGHDIDDMDEETQEMVVEHVKKYPDLLNALDIDEYARSVEQQTSNKKQETLADIKSELLHGFKDLRFPYKEPSQDEEFYLLTGENEETLSVGKIVQATACRVQSHRIICDMELGLTGIILKEELFDDLDIDPVEKIAEGSIVTCWAKTMTKAKYLVQLTCKESSLKNDNYQGEQDKDKEVKDPYFVEEDSIS